ncbi:MAG: hypothetical protein AAF135_01010 [Bacteroidota bacterium]
MRYSLDLPRIVYFVSLNQDSVAVDQLKRKDEPTTLSGLPTTSHGLLVPWTNTCEYDMLFRRFLLKFQRFF